MTQSQQEAIKSAADIIGGQVDHVFAGLANIAAVLEHLVLTANPLNRAALGVLREPLAEFIAAHGGLLDGAGVAMAPGTLADADNWLQWYRASEKGGVQFTSHSLNPTSVSYYDYTAMNWFQIPVRTRHASLTGPYIDIGGTDLKIVTASVPVVQGTDAIKGVVAADLSLDFIELLFLRTVGRRAGQTLLVTHSGKVIASNTSRHTAGTLLTEHLLQCPEEVSFSEEVRTTCQLASPWRILGLS